LSIREPTIALSTGSFSFKAEVTVPERRLRLLRPAHLGG
jgi:hypothetical protein